MKHLFGMAAFCIIAVSASGQSFAQEDGSGEITQNAEEIVVSGVSHRKTLACNNRRVVIEGASNEIMLTGVCTSLQISGAANTVSLTLIPKALITIEGASNRVEWRSEKPPVQKVSGAANEIRRAR